MSLKAVRKWDKAVSAKRQDNICSAVITRKAFWPTYDKAWIRPDIKMLVSMEYRRLWFDERSRWTRSVGKPQERGCFLRKHLPKDAWKNTQACMEAPEQPLRKIKRFTKTAARIDTGLGAAATDLVPRCMKCADFHIASEKCAATKLCDIEKVKAEALQ